MCAVCVLSVIVKHGGKVARKTKASGIIIKSYYLFGFSDIIFKFLSSLFVQKKCGAHSKQCGIPTGYHFFDVSHSSEAMMIMMKS